MISVVCELYYEKQIDEGFVGDLAYSIGKRLPGSAEKAAEKKKADLQKKTMLKKAQSGSYGGYGSKSYRV